MGVVLNTNYRISANGAERVGWPLPSAGQPRSAYERIAAGAREYRQAGFTAVLLPPSTKGGAGPFSDGYDKFDDYDIDGTAFGSGESLRQCVAALHAHELQAYGDLVLHQYGGGTAQGVYRTKRFPKHASCFVGPPPRVAVDQVPDMTGNFAFGDMASYTHSDPAGYMHAGAVAASQWLTRTTGMDGWRIDEAKGTHAQTVLDILQSPALRDKFAVGEYFDGNPGPVANWVNGYMQRRAAVLDFAFKFNVQNIGNNSSHAWMGQLANIGFCTIDPAMAMTFVESADTDTSPGEQAIWNKALLYAIMLTFPGYPQVYYRDWSDDPGCYGLKPQINNLIWIHETLANGDFVPRLDTDPQVFVHERTGLPGAPGCLCAFNNDQWNSYTRTVQTSFGPNQELHEYTGNGSTNNVWTDGQGRLTFTVPRNNNGASYLVYAKPMGEAAFGWRPQRTTQTFYGASDLSIPAAANGYMDVGRVWVAAGSEINATIASEHGGWTETSKLVLGIHGPAGVIHDTATLKAAGQSASVAAKTEAEGWHGLHLIGTDLPNAGSAFELTVTYQGGEVA